jgi:N-acetylmuramoyl-L-alanine amidase
MTPFVSMPSPNFNDRDPTVKLDCVILHYTDMESAEAALTRLCDPKAEVSAHYMIDEDGTIYALVAEEKRAWHAGKSFWRGVTDMNSASIGVELVNPGHSCGYRPFPDSQIAALKNLLAAIVKRTGIDAANIIGHSDVAPGRRPDPGELFPWRDLAQSGFGLWPEAGENDETPMEKDAAALLAAIGYKPPANEEELRQTLRAFQSHFAQQNLTGKADPETLARLYALKKIMKKREESRPSEAPPPRI